MNDKFFRYFPLISSVAIGLVGINGLVESGNASLMSRCMLFWVLWTISLLLNVGYESIATLSNEGPLIQPSTLEPLILIPLSLLPLQVIAEHTEEITIEPIWVCAVIAGLVVMGTVRLSEVILSKISDPLMRLMFRSSRKIVNRRYASNIPVICRSCTYCTAHTHLLCAIRPLGPEHPRHCQSFEAQKSKEIY